MPAKGDAGVRCSPGLSARPGSVQEHGCGRCACLFEAEESSLGQPERGAEGGTEQPEQHLGGEVLPQDSTGDAAVQHCSHRSGNEPLDLSRVRLDLFAYHDGIAIANRGQVTSPYRSSAMIGQAGPARSRSSPPSPEGASGAAVWSWPGGWSH